MILQLSGAFKQQKTKQQKKDLCIHASMHPYIHASMNPSIHPSMHPSIHASIHSYTHTCIHTYIHPGIHACLHAYIHAQKKQTYIHTHIHTYLHAYMHTRICISELRTFHRRAGTCPCKGNTRSGGDSVHRSRVIDTGRSRPDSDLHLHQCMRHPI